MADQYMWQIRHVVNTPNGRALNSFARFAHHLFNDQRVNMKTFYDVINGEDERDCYYFFY